MLIKRNRGGFAGSVRDFIARAESLKGFQRLRGGLFKRGIKLLQSAQRLAQSVSNLRRYFSQSIQHMVLVARLSFCARQRFPAYAVDGLDGQKILRPNLRDRTFENCRAAVRWQISRVI